MDSSLRDHFSNTYYPVLWNCYPFPIQSRNYLVLPLALTLSSFSFVCSTITGVVGTLLVLFISFRLWFPSFIVAAIPCLYFFKSFYCFHAIVISLCFLWGLFYLFFHHWCGIQAVSKDSPLYHPHHQVACTIKVTLLGRGALLKSLLLFRYCSSTWWKPQLARAVLQNLMDPGIGSRRCTGFGRHSEGII